MHLRYNLFFFFFLSSILISQPKIDFQSFIIKVDSESTLNTIKSKYPNVQISDKQIFHHFLNNFKKRNNSLSSSQSSIKKLENYYLINIPKSSLSTQIINDIKRIQGIISFEDNYIYRIEQTDSGPNDPLFDQQWGLKAVNATSAWLKATGKGVIVGVIDTGIDWDHKDLKDQLWINSSEDANHNGTFEPWSDTVKILGITGDLNGKDDDGNGYVDDVIGYSFVNQFVPNLGQSDAFSPVPVDEHSHGTIVSGVIAAKQNNEFGISGLAFNSKLMILRAFDATGSAQSDNIATAIVYAAANGAKVLNFSFGEEQASSIVHDAIKFAYSMGCVMVASSGNNGWSEHHYPSDFEEVISIGASNENQQRDFQSNYGSRLALLAPGSSILSTYFSNTFKKSSGTSLSAPFVSATATMLFEINPNLSPKSIYGILQASAKDIESIGWDEKTGSGILDAAKAVNFTGATKIEILAPLPASVVSSGKSKSLFIIGSVLTPLFDNFQLQIGTGNQPKKWTSLSEKISSQKNNDTLGMLDLTNLQDTLYTIRVIVNLKNNSTIEKRTYIQVSNNNLNFQLASFKVLDSWFGDKRSVVIAGIANQNSVFSVKFRPNNSTDDYTIVTDKNYESFSHTIVLTDEVPAGILMEAQAVFKRNDGFELIRPFSFMRKDEEATNSNFTKIYNTLPLLYLHNQVTDLYQNGKECFVANDLSYGLWQSTKIYEFSDNKFIQKDTLKDIWIPVGIGESNGDGLPEILTKSFGAGILFEADKSGNSPFSKILLQDTTSGNFRPAGMFDFDNDGRDEVIAFNDTAFHILKYNDLSYKIIASTKLDNDEKLIGTAPGYCFGDFDGDGKNELVYSNSNGQIFIYQYENGKLTQEFKDKNVNSSSSQIMVKADIDGDGIPEIAIFNYGSTEFFGREDAGDVIWSLKILKSTTPNAYNYIWQDYFYGVRSGSTRSGVTFRNGLSAGNLDKEAGDEIVVSPFPNLYIFKWDKKKRMMNNLWWTNSSFANAAIINDFNKNGINEIGFCSNSGTVFYELDSDFNGPKTPIGFSGYAINDTTAFLHWNKDQSFDSVVVHQLLLINDQYFVKKLFLTNLDSVRITGLKKETNYQFVLRSLNNSLKDSLSDYSKIADIYTHNSIRPLNVIPLNSREVLLSFSGKIPYQPIEPSTFKIIDKSNESLQISNSNRLNDTCVLISLSNELTNGAYHLFSSSFRDFYGTPSIETDLLFDFNSAEPKKEMWLTSLQVLNMNELLLEYSEDIDNLSSLNLANYTLEPIGKISTIQPNIANQKSVKIGLDKSELLGSLGNTYTLTVNNVKSVKNIPITTGPGNTLSFVFFDNTLNDVFVYPNPIVLNEKPNVVFANLTPQATVYILSESGELLRTIEEIDGNGGVEWDCKDKNGNLMPSGIYLFKVRGNSADGKNFESEFKKFAIIN